MSFKIHDFIINFLPCQHKQNILLYICILEKYTCEVINKNYNINYNIYLIFNLVNEWAPFEPA